MAELTVLGLTEMHIFRGRSLALLMEPAPARLEMRNILRMVLSQITARPPEALRFETTIAGKPYLAGDHSVAFNLSHSRSHSLIALSLSGDIGCDIEDRFRTDDDVDQLSTSILHPVEQQEMNALAAPKRQDAFKRYWVRKEAALKAAGSGFLRDPRDLIVGLDFAQARWSENDGPDLYLHNRQLGQDCFAAVASRDSDCAWYLLRP